MQVMADCQLARFMSSRFSSLIGLFDDDRTMAGHYEHSASNRFATSTSKALQNFPHTGVVLRFTPSFKSLGKQLWTCRNSAAASCSGLYVFSVMLSLARAYMDSSSKAPLEDGAPFRPTTGEFSRDASVE